MLLHHTAEKVSEYINSWEIEPVYVSILGTLFITIFTAVNDPAAFSATLTSIAIMSPVWLPIFLFTSFWITWIEYIRYFFWFKMEYILLEIQLPPEVEKSPLAMELFLIALHNNGSETTFLKRVWEGSHRPVWSLEIASNEGQIRYYIHLTRGWRPSVEARLYGQFPEAKVTEVPDYTSKIPFNLDDYLLEGSEYQKSTTKPQVYPIRTYVDWKLDKDPDEELKIDPLSSILEVLGHVGEGEHFWLQIIIKARKEDEWYGIYTGDSYGDQAKAELGVILKGAGERAKGLVGSDPQLQAQAAARGLSLLTQAEKDKVEAIERQQTKLLFECGIRTVYVARKDKYRGINIPNMVRFFDPYKNPHMNGLGCCRNSFFDYPWADFKDIRRNRIRMNYWHFYKHRAYFYVPYDQDPVFLTTEELASIWHFPGSIVKTPTLSRVPAKVSGAPANIPIQKQ